MGALRNRIKHVVYIVKENRTYDGVLGDLSNGANGDPTLAVFGRRITPRNVSTTLIQPGLEFRLGWSGWLCGIELSEAAGFLV